MPVRYRYLPTLDGWRAFSIFAVIISHARSPLFTGTSWVAHVAAYGGLGVNVFFAISGVLICGRLLDETGQGGIDLRAFYIRRAFRILPPYLLYLAALAALTFVGAVSVSFVDFASTMLFVRNYFMLSPTFSVYTNHFWSLSVEEHFYMLWPLTLRMLGRRRAAVVVGIACFVVHAWRGACAHLPHFTGLFPSTGILWRTDTRIDGLLWGALGALVMEPLTPFFARRSWTLPILAILVVATWRHAPQLPLIQAIGFVALILSTVLNPTSLAHRFLEWSPLRWVGRLSYSLYLWQTLFFEVDHPAGWLGFFQRPPVNVVALGVCACASYYIVEKPVLAFGRALAARPRVTSSLTSQPVSESP